MEAVSGAGSVVGGGEEGAKRSEFSLFVASALVAGAVGFSRFFSAMEVT